MAGVFNKARGCFTSKKSGVAMKGTSGNGSKQLIFFLGLTRSHDFKMSAYACKKSRVAGMRRGTKLDVELSDHINKVFCLLMCACTRERERERERVQPILNFLKGTELVSKRAKDMMQHLKAAGLYPVEAQLVVANARKRIATAIDMVWKTVENNKPVLVELKCTGKLTSFNNPAIIIIIIIIIMVLTLKIYRHVSQPLYATCIDGGHWAWTPPICPRRTNSPHPVECVQRANAMQRATVRTN